MISYKDELYHHGIKGQRWGVRRYQNEDGSLTAAGRARYNVDVSGARENLIKSKKAAIEAQKTYNKSYSQEDFNRLQAANAQAYWARKDLKSEQIKEKLNQEHKISNHRKKLEQSYRDKGMNDEEAAVAAYKRVKTEKILAGIAGATLVAATAYVAYKHYDRNVDKIISADTVLSRISSSGERGVHDAFYASFNTSDNHKYLGLYGGAISEQGKSVFQKSIKLGGDLKVASEKTAKNTLSDLVTKNSKTFQDFRTEMHATLLMHQKAGSTEKQMAVLNKAVAALDRGQVDSHVYEAFNLNLPNKSKFKEAFYGKLKEQGYDAITDINDKRLSGYNSKSPIIVFNSAKANVDAVRSVGQKEINKAKTEEYAKMLSRETGKSIGKLTAKGAASLAGIAAVGSVTESRNNDRYVREYHEQHPNTKLSYNEILKNRHD